MKLKPSGVALSMLAAGALLLAGCGSDNNAPAAPAGGGGGNGESTVQCGGKTDLEGQRVESAPDIRAPSSVNVTGASPVDGGRRRPSSRSADPYW